MLLSFRLNDMAAIAGGPDGAAWWDKVPSKFAGWGDDRFREAGFRAVPGCVVRRSAYIAPGRRADALLRQSRRPCRPRHHGRHLGDGRLLRPDRQELPHLAAASASAACWSRLQAGPVIIEDDCFIGARSEVAEGVIVEQGSVLSMGVFSAPRPRSSTAPPARSIIGRVPAYSVVVPGTLPGKPLPDGSPGPALYCAVIVKRVDAQTRAKTSINELLRD